MNTPIGMIFGLPREVAQIFAASIGVPMAADQIKKFQAMSVMKRARGAKPAKPEPCDIAAMKRNLANALRRF